MEKYIFSMEKVLDYREDIEKLKREEFAKINLEISQLETEIAKINIELKEINERIFKIQNANELFQIQLYRQALEEKLELQKLRLSEKRKALEDKRVELTKAQTDKKIIEKLKEKDYSQFMYKKNLKEQKELDEFSVMRFKHAKN
jgi:flagellar FliJ protein